MTELPLQRATAAKWASIMLAGAILAGALALGVFLLPPPRVETPSSATSAAAPPAPKRERRLVTDGITTDWSRIASDIERFNAPDIAQWKKDEEKRLAELMNAPKGDPNGEPGAAPGGGFLPAWRYLGAVIDGERKTALVVIPDTGGQPRQRFVAEGFQKDEYRVVSIEPDKLVIEQGRRRHEIPITPNARGIAIGVSASSPPARTAQPFGANTPGMPNQPNRGGVVPTSSRGRPNPAAPGSVPPGTVTPQPGTAPPQPGADPNYPDGPNGPGIN